MDQTLTTADARLIEEASAALLAVHDPATTRVAAAVLGGSGAVHLGVSLRSARVSVCAESTAVANAKMAGEEEIETIVAVGLGEDGVPLVINPCGVCRELVPAIAPHVRVLVDAGDRVVAVSSPELLPMPWKRARSYD